MWVNRNGYSFFISRSSLPALLSIPVAIQQFFSFSHLNDTISLHATDHNVQKSARQTQAKVQFIVSHRKLFLKRLKQQQQKPHHHHQQQKALAQKFHLNLDVKCFTSLNPLKAFFWGKNDCIIMECCWFCLLCASVFARCVCIWWVTWACMRDGVLLRSVPN